MPSALRTSPGSPFRPAIPAATVSRDARALAANLGIELLELPIGPLHDAAEEVLAPVFQDTEPGVAEENLQSRLRGVLLMAHSNKTGAMLLTTGNKSETAVGYATLYGDMCGALAPIADLWKTEVYGLARWLNRDRGRIPEATIAKPPSAELRPDQKDTDSLPDYDRLDPVLKALVEDQRPVAEVAAATGMDLDEVARLARLVQRTEFKRFQYAPTLRVSTRHWGARRFPVAHGFLDGDPGLGRLQGPSVPPGRGGDSPPGLSCAAGPADSTERVGAAGGRPRAPIRHRCRHPPHWNAWTCCCPGVSWSPRRVAGVVPMDCWTRPRASGPGCSKPPGVMPVGSPTGSVPGAC